RTRGARAARRARAGPRNRCRPRRRREEGRSWPIVAIRRSEGSYVPAMARRGPDFRLEEAIASPSFTPGARDFPPLFDLLGGGDERLSDDAERALVRAGNVAAQAAIARF